MGDDREHTRTATHFSFDALNCWHRDQVLAKRRAGKNGAVVPRLECNDGFVVSVQASETHYCEPREDNAWPYVRWELGYPSAKEEALMTYAEDDTRPTDTVYGFVPTSNVMLVIEKHGGIKGAALSKAGV